MYLPGDQIGSGLRHTFVRHMRELHTRHRFKQLGNHVRGTAAAAGGVIQLVRLRFGQRDKVFERFHRQRRRHNQNHWRRRGACHRRKIALNVVARLGIQTHVDRVRVGAEHESVAVGRGARGQLRADVAARATAIVDHDLLAKRHDQLLRNNARHNVAIAARRIRHQKAQRAVGVGGIGLRYSRAGCR